MNMDLLLKKKQRDLKIDSHTSPKKALTHERYNQIVDDIHLA